MEKKLTKGMLYVLYANILNMAFNLIANFILPKYLSISTYSAIKTFQLYINYIGILHLGFVDGVYLEYGGRELKNVNNDRLSVNLSTLRIFQVVVMIAGIIVSIFLKDFILLSFSLTILPLNITTYFRMLFQAIGEFKIYSRITNLTTGITFLINIILLFLVKTDHFMAYLLGYVMVNVIIWIVLEIYFTNICKNKIQVLNFSVVEFIKNIKSGFSLMCGNFASFLLTGMDRWFVKFTLDTVSFAQFSFAVSLENMLNLAITPITIPLYNYFCRERANKKIQLIHRMSIIFAVLIISLAFIAELAIKLILPNYIEASKVIILLFAAQAFQIVIKAVYVNLYKVEKEQTKYFIKIVLVIISGFIFNIICFNIVKVKEGYAWGTLLSAFLWYLISIPDFKKVIGHRNDIIYLFIEVVVFLLIGFYCEPLMGIVLYLSVSGILSIIIMKRFWKEAIDELKIFLKRERGYDK